MLEAKQTQNSKIKKFTNRGSGWSVVSMLDCVVLFWAADCCSLCASITKSVINSGALEVKKACKSERWKKKSQISLIDVDRQMSIT